MKRLASEVIRELEQRIARLENQSRNVRSASTNKVAGHIVVAAGVNVRKLQRDLENTFGVEDVELDEGVLTFLMDKFENQDIEKQIKALAKKHKVKFEKGEMTDGLGMIHTSSRRMASRRRTASGEPAIETSTERELDKAWPKVSYQGEGDFINTYMKWIREVEAQEIGEGLETDHEDQFGNTLEVSWSQECYLGYNQKEDYFVMGFDLQLYSPESAEAYRDHQYAMEEYRDALEEWENGDQEDDEPIEDDFRGYDYDYEGVDNPEDGVYGWATVTFKANGYRVKVLDVKIESEARFYNSFDSGFDNVKREHRGIIHLRLD